MSADTLATIISEHGLAIGVIAYLMVRHYRLEQRIDTLVDLITKNNTILAVLTRSVDPQPEDALRVARGQPGHTGRLGPHSDGGNSDDS